MSHPSSVGLRASRGPLVLLLALLACGDPGATPGDEDHVAAAAPPHVIVWLVDTLRADHLGAYGYERPTSPHFDAFAAEAVLFDNANVHSNWTKPSVTSLLSGAYPPVFSANFTDTIPSGLILAPQWFGAHGWDTAGFTITLATSARFGFGRGYDSYVELDGRLGDTDRRRREGPAFDADRVVDAGLAWIDDRESSEDPFFLYLHSVDPHIPYETHAEHPSFADPEYDGPVISGVVNLSQHEFSEADKQALRDLYDDEVRYNDMQFGRLVAGLRERGVFDNTILVVVSDHGEEFWDRRSHGHGQRNLHAELTHVPLVMSWPDGLPSGVRVRGVMRGIDIVPTLVELVGLEPIPSADGVSVHAAMLDGELSSRNPMHFADRSKEPIDVVAMRTDGALFHRDPEGHTSGLYDLSSDSAALVDVRDEALELRGRMATALKRWTADRDKKRAELASGRTEIELDPELEESLRAMGYLGEDDG